MKCSALAAAAVGTSWPRAGHALAVDEAPAEGRPAGKIYTTTNARGRGKNSGTNSVLVAIDPASGDVATVLEPCEMRPRVSPDGKLVAFRRSGALWVRAIAGKAKPKKILDLDDSSACSPVWSADGKEIIVSPATKPNPGEPWVFRTYRVNADGSEKTELKIPSADGVQDWSADGQWLLTTSSRSAKIGWQLYVMRLDGTDVRQITEGGNPFYTRFSPDGRRFLYTDGTTEERRGIWVANVDGTNRRNVLPTGGLLASACWSPDGKQIAVLFRDLEGQATGEDLSRIEILDLKTERRTLIPLAGMSVTDMPDWR